MTEPSLFGKRDPTIGTVDSASPYYTVDSNGVQLAEDLLTQLGIVVEGDHNKRTPTRLTHYLSYVQAGAVQFRVTTFPNEDPVISDMQIIPNITFWSACSHHCLPFFGVVHVGYIPGKFILGLSKIPLLVRAIARGYWVQEHLANAIADAIEKIAEPQGLGVLIEAQHTCQLMDLKQPPIPVMRTSIIRGLIMHGPAARDEFYRLIERG